MKKVLLITNIPNPYRIPLFNELSEQLSKQGWLLKVIFGAKTYSRRKFEISEKDFLFQFEYLNSAVIQLGEDNEKTTFSYKGLIGIIRREKPDLVITNGFSPATLLVWAYRLVGGPRYLIWSGAILAPGRYDSTLRKLQRKLLAKGAEGFVVYGSSAADYLKSLGIGNKPVHTAVNTVDTTFFSTETSLRRRDNADNGKKHLTFTGYLVKRKGVEKLLQCIKVLAGQRSDFVLDILGDGSDKAALEAWCAENGISHLVRFHGFVQKQDLPSHLARTDVFLFQTDFDIWGLVLNEAMAAGLTVIASPNAGASRDLIRNGENGYISDFSDHQKTATLISNLLDDPQQCRKTGERAAEFIREKGGIRQSAEGFTSAILKANR